MEYRICFTGVMLCCQSVLTGPCNTYKERCRTGKEMTDDRVCFALLFGRKRKVQSAIKKKSIRKAPLEAPGYNLFAGLCGILLG
ncbi:MAG TPA: hypothetical protein VK369_01755 [Segetibacter sp.]|nr:hypothetical protein [Segetibacter sp.]